eukprot:CAMPEP_0116009640 /NCGR_PEP_ID=MMETSP0321-20121206/3546_1 /TAXON_ID=163516 /ORGANISM="Leptocylindrus danicus var. danicus, Strain B650" /LENGTH=242 /DNA_ID=CAMNT_0003478627 /DNA_START=28 /DNA_END=756 /DNA_ORIENTATION=+
MSAACSRKGYAIIFLAIVSTAGLFVALGLTVFQPAEDKSKATVETSSYTNTTDTTYDDDEGSQSSTKLLIELELSNLMNDATTGKVIIELKPEWAPIGVERFLNLTEDNFWDDCRFFRVVPNFIVQFGINGDVEKQAKWREQVIPDDPVQQTNRRGTMVFASAGPNTRTSQMFINTGTSNSYLDGYGFAPIGEVMEGMDFVDAIYDGHREDPQQPQIQSLGNQYLLDNFPELSYIVSGRLAE